MATFLVGSRASNLAKAQVREYLAPLRERFPDVTFTHRVILEGGDKDRKSALSNVSAANGGSAFSTEQEAALARGDVDVIVHSLKDLPTSNPPGLILLPPPGREDVRDALCGSTLAGLRKGARVGTVAPRRIAQLLAVRPDLDVIPIRGNVPPRLKKIETMGGEPRGIHAIRAAERCHGFTPAVPGDHRFPLVNHLGPSGFHFGFRAAGQRSSICWLDRMPRPGRTWGNHCERDQGGCLGG